MPSWFARFFHRRSLAHPTPELLRIFDVGPTAAGISVTPAKALSVPAVYACVSVLAQDVAKTPIKMRRRVAEDTFVDAVDADLWEILHALPNPETSAYSFKHELMIDLLTHERAFAEIVRTDGRVVALWRLDPARMQVDRTEARRKRWRYTDERGQTHEYLFDPSRPPIFELAHPSPLRHCRELVGTALALQRYVGKFFANGARPGGALQTDMDLDPDQQAGLRAQFTTWHEGTENAHKVGLLTGGMKYQAIAAANDESQLNETLQTIRTEIAGVFRVPTWKVGDMTKATYSNMEAGENAYVNGTLDPFFTCWEHAIRRDLLTTRQYGQYDVTFDRSTLIRNDIKSLHEALARARDAGIYTANDIRRKLGENPIAADQGGDLLLINGNMRPVTEAGRDEPAS